MNRASAEPSGTTPPWGRADVLALLALVVVGLLPRVLALGADPPTDVSPAFLFDEGWWAHNARNRVLFGRWIIDEHNPSILVAPLYTWTLAGLYRLVGVGLAETRLLSGLAGFASCLIVYAVLRTERPVRRALPPTLLLAASYFMLTQNRIGLTESFQLLFVTGVFGATVLATRRPAWAAAGGAAFVLALLAKPSALVIAPIVAAFWPVHAWLARRDASLPRARIAAPVTFIGVAALGLGLVAITLMMPHWEPLQDQLALSRFTVTARTVGPREALSYVGWAGFGMTLNPFFVQTAVPLLAVALLAAARLTGGERHRSGTLVETLSWIWLGVGLLALAVQRFQPDRRFLLLMPAVAVLAGLAFERTLAIGPAGGRRVRFLVAGGLLGGWLGFYGYPLLTRGLGAGVAGRVPLLAGPAGPNALLLAGGLGGVALAALWLGPGRRVLPRSLRVPGTLLLALFLVAEPGRFLLYASHLTYTMRDASRWLDQFTASWSPADRAIVGNQAATLSLETRLFPFQIRSEGSVGAENLDGWDRFRPALSLITGRGAPPDSLTTGHGFVHCRTLELWPARGEPRGTWGFELYARPDRCPEPTPAATGQPRRARSASRETNLAPAGAGPT